MKKIVVASLCVLYFLTLGNLALAADEAINMAANKIDEGFSETIVTSKGADPSNTIQSKVGEAIAVGLGIIGSIALCIFIYGGIMWMTSGGVEQNITKAQNTMVWAALGLFAIFCSYMIVNYMLDHLKL